MRVIRLGDKTSHGGEVITASNFDVMGKMAVREHDICTCPIKGHGSGGILGGDANWTVDDRAVALEGISKTHCGADIYSSCSQVERTFEGDGSAGLGQGFNAANTSNASSTSMANEISFDEQLQFLSKSGKPYSNIDYKLILADGSNASGKTDATGKTERIVSDQATMISRAEFYPLALTCCARHAEESATDEPALVVELQGVQTNPQDIGSSIVKVTAEGESRPLTSGEIAMCKLIFKNAIDYSLVKVHNHEYLPFGVQDDNTAMTPNGEIYFNPDRFKPDFSSESTRNKIWFIHEMVHVWQYHLGYNVKWHGMRLGLSGEYKDGNAYQYSSNKDARKKLADFNMEQQGEVISHYFGFAFLGVAEQYFARLGITTNEKFLRGILDEFIKAVFANHVVSPFHRWP